MKKFILSSFYIFSCGLLLISCSSGPTNLGGNFPGFAGQALSAEQMVTGSSPEAVKLRTNLQNLVFKLNSYSGYTSQQLGNLNNATAISTTITSVAQTLSGSSVINPINEIAAIKGSMPPALTIQTPFNVPGSNAIYSSTWDALIVPQLTVHVIRIQASYVTALIQYMLSNIARLTPMDLQSLSNTVATCYSQLTSLPV